MKLALQTKAKTNSKILVIRFKQLQAVNLEKGKHHVYNMRTIPTEDKSLSYKLTVPFSNSGTPQDWNFFCQGIAAVIAGKRHHWPS